jgi:hypothetical protein
MEKRSHLVLEENPFHTRRLTQAANAVQSTESMAFWKLCEAYFRNDARFRLG